MIHRKPIKALLCAALAVLAQPALAQNYPNKPIRFIVGFAPGGPNDILARIVGQKMSENMGVTVAVDNRPGADSMIGTQMVARSAPDGYTISMVSAGITIHPNVYTNIPYDVVKDFSHISVLASGAYIAVVNPSLPVKTLKEFIAHAQANPGKLNYATSGMGGSLHLATELFKTMAKLDINHIAYKGGVPAANDLLSGQVQFMIGAMSVATAHVRSGKLRALAVTSPARWPALPDVPTFAEAGVPGYEATGWYGVVGPANLPRPIMTRINQEIVKAITVPEVRQQIAKFDLSPVGSSPEEMSSHINTELVKWANVARSAKLERGTLN